MAGSVAGRPSKNFFLLSSLITVQNLIAVRRTVWAYMGGSKNLERWDTVPWDRPIGGVTDTLGT